MNEADLNSPLCQSHDCDDDHNDDDGADGDLALGVRTHSPQVN